MTADDLDKIKNEEANRSLSISINDGRGLIAIATFDRRPYTNSKPDMYSFFVTKPGVDDTYVCVVMKTPDVHALIDILERIIEREDQ
ncbi:hypothetical protein LCGC14_1297260 [marine sediment metagenome]|uniref:Uncharacterized protein n=1 Tax=marine sediment metagenome TaxID=412755 RepID=A0A0F9N796_9ZZZZ